VKKAKPKKEKLIRLTPKEIRDRVKKVGDIVSEVDHCKDALQVLYSAAANFLKLMLVVETGHYASREFHNYCRELAMLLPPRYIENFMRERARSQKQNKCKSSYWGENEWDWDEDEWEEFDDED